MPGAILLFFYVVRLNLHSPVIEVNKKLIGVLPVAGIPYFHMFWRHLNQNFRLQKQINGQWYTMPVQADNIGFEDLACVLPDGKSASETYDLNIYGTLEPGIYRLVVQNLSVEFLVGHGNLSAKRD